MVQPINGVTITPLKTIEHIKGDIFHALTKDEQSYVGFGEAYFSSINHGCFKGWKQHKQMTLNIVVPVGSIHFYFVNVSKNGIEKFSIELSSKNYVRITVDPGVWLGFKGAEVGLNMLLNIANIPHDISESINVSEDYWMHLFN